MYAEAGHFRSRVVMERHAYGRGEYQYFARPLPELIATLRRQFYDGLYPIANHWAESLRSERRFPATYDEFLAECHAQGQTRPTPLLLRYGAGDYNRLHQDLYGACVFPMQIVILLSDPQSFAGGELCLLEQRPRMQSRVSVVPIRQGEAIVFAVHHRPVPTARGVARAIMRHGVSELRVGERHTLGVILHDAA
jgi:hypothetical protein